MFPVPMATVLTTAWWEIDFPENSILSQAISVVMKRICEWFGHVGLG